MPSSVMGRRSSGIDDGCQGSVDCLNEGGAHAVDAQLSGEVGCGWAARPWRGLSSLTLGICWVRGLRCCSRFSFSFSRTSSRGDSWLPGPDGSWRAELLLGLQQVLQQAAQFGPDVVAGGHFTQRDPQRGQFPGQVFGVRQVAFRALAVLLEGNTVPVVLAVLRQQQQRRGVGGLQGQHQRQEREAEFDLVELPVRGREGVPGQPEHTEHGHVEQELRRAHETGEPLRRVAERIGIRRELGQDALPAAQRRVQAALACRLSRPRGRCPLPCYQPMRPPSFLIGASPSLARQSSGSRWSRTSSTVTAPTSRPAWLTTGREFRL